MAKHVWELKESKLVEYLGNYDDYKEKHKQLEQRNVHVEIAVPKQQKKAIEVPKPKQNLSLERNRAHLEQAIAEVEQQLAELDTFFQTPNCADDAGKYSQAVIRWEALKAELELYYEQWIELEK
ncbi:unnamed protein product [Aphanomyces euteiches]